MRPIILIILLATSTVAQTPARHRFTLDWGDGAYWIGSTADLATSRGLKERNGFLRGDDGCISMGKGIAFKGGLFGALKTLDFFYPEHPKVMRWAKVFIGVGFGAAAFHNSRVRR